ncbi:eukaryotic translation initiation factor 5B-like [Ruditapes philippinarum]|uniref:eukaryotic translation initiation factor 5B-like n=1 Tax=Ruditapes philippinarum TaxID=129788 RepID=UPI00295BC8AC|nr:eukaryotic translation initiation factor 5B-like [Ruditapes philippinarum]
MGKPKNKAKDNDVDSDVDIVESEATEAKPVGKQSKKDKKKKKKDDDWEDDVANELQSLSLEANKGRKEENSVEEERAPVKKKEKKKKKKQQADSEEEEEEDSVIDTGGKRGKKMAAFNMLMMEDEDTKSMSEQSDNEEEPVIKEEVNEQQKKKDKKKDKKKGKEKQKTAEEEDLDALLAEIDAPKMSKKAKKEKKKQEAMEVEEKGEGENEVVENVEVEKVEPKVVSIDDYDDDEDDKKKRKKKKDKVKKEVKGEEDGDEEKAGEGEGEEEGGTVKSAAQKKKEKKEKERLKKLEQKKKQALKKDGKVDEPKSEEKTEDQGAAAEDKAASGDDETKEEEDDGKKKKKKKKGDKEEKPKKSKAPVSLEIKTKEEEVVEAKKKRPIYEKKKKKPQQKQDDSEPTDKTPSPEDTPAQTPVSEEAPSIVETPEAESSEAVVDTEEKEEVSDIKDEWDISSEEEEEEEEEKESSPETETKAEAKGKKVEVKVEDDDEDDEDDDDEESDDEGDDEDDDDDESESDSESDDDLTPYERAEIKLKKLHEKCEANRTVEDLRAPVVCVLGHVDTGKTKILDKLRRTNVQDGEAGGITQQIGATNVPHQAILDKTTMCKEFQKKGLKLPGLLIIDTPGHESFSNLRSRGSSLCDIAILVIDIMHGLEPQTIESINLLKDKKTPFVVALNKIDRLYQWKSNPNSDVVNVIKKQTQMCKQEYDERSQAVITQLAEQGLNAALFYENKNPKEYISLVPTSAHSGDGMGNLLSLICELTQTWLAKKVSYSQELHATVMEVKAIHGLGTTIDVILVNGKLNEGDQIVIAGTEGPIVTWIRGLLMPQPMKELRVKAQYEHHKEVKAAQGVKVIGKDLEKALAGLPLYVAHDEDEVEYFKEELSEALKDVLGSIKLSERGVFVQASTLGSLEALLEFLRTSKIPYAGINIGPVHKKDIMKASIMLEHDTQWAVILAFDVKVEREAQEMADSLGVKIFTADIIYHLQDAFIKFREDLKKQKQEEFKNIAVFPCKLRVLPQYIFNSRDPIVVGVSVEAGVVKVGTPICVPSKEFVFLGIVSSLEVNHKTVDVAKKGQEVCVKIENVPSETPKLYGRHFDHTDMLTSRISRTSIDAVKDHFRDEMTKQDWALMVELKKLFQIL